MRTEDMMEPFYFGTSPRKLFGMYHSPLGRKTRDAGIVLCYPEGQEYIRSHRAFLRLAVLLASTGFHVLRFDYSGCGDSQGNGYDSQISHWIDDISTAVEELRGGSGVNRIGLIGLRLGGSLSMMAGCGGVDAEGIVLWNPVVCGKEYVKELMSSHQEWLRGSFAKPKPGSNTRGQHEILGFPLTNSMLSDLEEIDLRQLRQKPAKTMLLITSSESVCWDPLKEHIKDIGVNLQCSHVPAPEIWIKADDEIGKGLVPVKVLEHISSWSSKAFQ
jgi:hypothetical protein